MNKILIALVLIFGLSGNAYSVMIDVRTDEEWNGGHIEGAIHIHNKTLFISYPLVNKE